MGAGIPNWQKLNAMGRLPKHGRKFIGGLKEIDELKKKVCVDCRKKLFGEDEESKIDTIISETIKVKCDFEGCDYEAEARTQGIAANTLRLHKRSHEDKIVNEG